MLTNPRDAFTGKSRSPNIVPFHIIIINLLNHMTNAHVYNCMNTNIIRTWYNVRRYEI